MVAMTSVKPVMRYGLLALGEQIEFVEMPASHMYQLTALFGRLHKEIDKLSAAGKPALSALVAEFDNLDVVNKTVPVWNGLEYVNRLEKAFASVQETEYPLISLLTEIRALQAQLEQWYEEAEEQAELL
jgi:hypothetical protein